MKVQGKETKYNMTENEKLRRAFIAATVAVVAVGVLFLVVMSVSLMRIGDAIEKAPAVRYDLNCLTEPIQNPLEECKL